MQKFFLLLFPILLAEWAVAQPQITVTLITDQGVKQAKSLEFILSSPGKPKPTLFSKDGMYFKFDNFSDDGVYANTNLFQYSKNLPAAMYQISIQLDTAQQQRIIDSLNIDSSTARTEVLIFISTTLTKEDYIKEVKTIAYKRNGHFLTFSPKSELRLGTAAEFTIQNKGGKTVMGYPNPAFFFGTLYEETGEDEWTQHYPKSIDIKYCDTITKAHPLATGQTSIAWPPDEKTCAPFKFTKKGNYYFELLYSTDSRSISFQGLTKLNKASVYRQIVEFKL